mgnify:CR=1 FL=1
MHWIPLTNMVQLDDIIIRSKETSQVIFKHSTRCSISVMAKDRLERAAFPTDLPFHYLDLLNHRDISNKIAETFSVAHESPQILIIKKGECVYDESHNGIRPEEILSYAS